MFRAITDLTGLIIVKTANFNYKFMLSTLWYSTYSID